MKPSDTLTGHRPLRYYEGMKLSGNFLRSTARARPRADFPPALRRLGLFAIALIALATVPGCSPGTSGTGDNVILIVIDTMRPDHLGCYGYALPTSPNIDGFAAEATLFEQTATASPLTLPSMSAMLTSTYPVFNNVRYNGMFFLNDASITLAEILSDNGYETAAFIGGFPLDSMFRTDQGFDLYDDDFSDSTQKRKYGWIGHLVDDFERTGEEVNRQTFKWLEKIGNKRFFLMVHYFDPHLPYTPPDPYKKKFDIPYDGEVAYTDDQIGALLEKLEELGLKEKSLIVLTGDHGESLGTHNEITHGEFIYDTTVMIPLIIYHGERIPKGRRIATMVRSIDIMPTILDFLDIPNSPHAQGRSLLPALDGKLQEAPALLEATLHYYEATNLGHEPMMITGLRTSDWKLMYVAMQKDGKPGWIAELYDIANEPLEQTNVSRTNPVLLESLIENLNSMTRIYSKGALPDTNRLDMDEDTKAKLKALGYLGS